MERRRQKENKKTCFGRHISQKNSTQPLVDISNTLILGGLGRMDGNVVRRKEKVGNSLQHRVKP